ncbi:cyanophycinase [Mesoterricola silvestris]|uniref:Cyanophycinase n=1 Tax=Mesoterricola silvestris TaxID=2927979 RepID=A0AA48GJB6_9BACT|nr:cyanophycinase [Mesoterricola silvestris]BDU74051.1 cyanophycinase [Mesoterricola silvestris]
MLRSCLLLLLTCLLGAAPPKGTLVIVGGHGTTPDIMDAFLKGAGGRGGVIGIIPTATEDPEGEIKDWNETLPPNGITLVPLDVRKREDSSAPAMLEAAARCTGFWFSGGDQARVGDKIVGTPLQKLILDKYKAGAVVGGTSAGAAIMSKIMLVGEDVFGKLDLREMGPNAYITREGMGFLPPDVVIDQHFVKRGRQNRLLSIAMTYPGVLAIGVDETTALVVRKGVGTVYGASGVMVFDTRGMKLKGGSFTDLKLHFLRKGGTIDLATRAVKP